MAEEGKEAQAAATASMSAEELRAEGNREFVAKNYVRAVELYTRALEQDPTQHLAFGNRSAAYLHMNNAELALQDANEAIRLCPTWIKGYFRRATACQALGRLRDARDTLREGLRHEPQNSVMQSQHDRVCRAVTEADKQRAIVDDDDWLEVFRSIPDKPLRMATLAHCWNRSVQSDRLSILRQFLRIISGGSETGEHFTPEQMAEMPMDNYAMVDVPEQWIEYVEQLGEPRKAALFAHVWESCSEHERTLIVHDMHHFFGPRADEVAGSSAAAADEAAEEEGGEEEAAGAAGRSTDA